MRQSPPSCFLRFCSMFFTASLGSPSLSKVLTLLTILSSANTKKVSDGAACCAVPASLYAFFKLHFSPGGWTVPPPSVDGFWQGCCGQPSQQLHGSQVMALQDSALLLSAAPRPLSAHLVILRSFQNVLKFFRESEVFSKLSALF